ncbi:S8 family serine peptidase [Alkalimonas collagenimarina]|uniref:Collagenolytic subtilisin-like serine protease n=1 Tax=Alkalimonas collagenimarina TaxID=400390 RepID=D0VYQ9_9GAMM|nr:S8 family serine peptidase [Alkalimonas collagenimarina]MDP4535462.1 S8 family serine peptidase [Alkalimonas collagenimarina]BAI50017.1 collagenolytic subtilisin-like serine protease [Alkalimonas collagenimarina]
MSKPHFSLAIAKNSLIAMAVSAALATPVVALAADSAEPSSNRYIIHYKADQLAQSNVSLRPGQSHEQAALQLSARALERLGAKTKLILGPQRAIAAELPDAVYKRLQADPTIELIEPDLVRRPMAQQTPYGYTMVQADQVSDQFASNQTVCVIDSGLDLPHEDFLDANITGTNDPGTGNWFEAGGPHGTHVAGTIAALNNDVGIVGVLPNGELKLHIVKVFNAAGWGYSSSLVNAINVCADNGSTVVNMSLGGAGSSVAESNAMQSIYDSGVLLVAAAGNGGNTSLSYPASYDSVISVAAVDDTKTLAGFSQRNAQVELAGPGVDVRSTYPEGTGMESMLSVDGVVFDPNPLDNAGSGSISAEIASCGLGLTTCDDMVGKVCLIQRGEVAFAQKVESCQDGGGLAAIIYNNESGNFSGTLGDNPTTTIPAVSLSLEEGEVLMGQLGDVADLTSGASNYGLMSGTSMASPHVAGVAALVWSHFPDCSNDEIRSALGASAEDLGAPGRDTSYGWGLVQAKDAFDYLTTHGCEGSGDPVDPDPDPTPPGTVELENDVPVTDLAGDSGEQLFFTLDVPADSSDLSFVMSGGTGDADLYVKFGSEPSLSDWDCRPFNFGNEESCSFETPMEGTYHVMINGYTAFSGVSLVGSFTAADIPDDPDEPDAGGYVVNDISIARRNWDYYSVDVPAGASSLVVEISGGRGDADLHVRHGAVPTATQYDCKPSTNGNNEVCTFSNPTEGTWHIGLHAFRAVSNLTLKVSYE